MLFSAISRIRYSTFRSLKQVVVLALAFGSMAGFTPANAQVVTSVWIGSALTGAGNWSDTLLWLPPPQPEYNVTIANLVFPAAVNLDVNATVNQLSLGAGATLTIANGRNLELTANSTINGSLFLNSTGGATELRMGSAAVTLGGTGSIVMSANAGNRIRGGTALGLINQVTISGSGTIGDSLMDLANQGAIIATDPSVPLVIEPNASGMTNTGTLRAANGATLELKDRTFLNSSGTIIADANSHIDLVRSTVVGGTLSSVGTGHFHAVDAVLSGVTISAGSTVELSNGDVMTLVGSIVNNGLVSVLATSGSNELRFDGAVTLSGTGNITLSDSTTNRISAATTNSVLTIGSAQTIFGAGELGRNTLGLINQGTIVANRTNALLIDNVGSSFTNSGVLRATGTGGMTLSDASVTNMGTVEISSGSKVNVAGTFTQSGTTSATKLSGGLFSSTGFALQTGSLDGSGTVSGSVNATGSSTILPGGGGSVGTLAFTSSLNLGPSTGVFFDLGGTAPGTGHDRINGTSITLDGSLFLTFTNGFQSSVSSANTLTLINASTALNGTFASLPNGSRLTTTDGFGSFQVNYLATTLTLSNFQPIPEPSTYVLLTVGAAGVLVVERRRRRRL